MRRAGFGLHDFMKVLVLGGFGFIGAHVVASLVGRGHAVRVLEWPGQRPHELVLPQWNDVELLEGDFLDADTVSAALQGVEAVVHLVCTVLPEQSNENPIHDIETNVVGTVRMLALARRHRVRKIVFSSSGGTIYGRAQTIPITEDHRTEPLCSYGITKLTIEKYLELSRQLGQLNYAVLRCSNPYGEGQGGHRPQGAVGVFLSRLKEGKPIHIWGDGLATRDYVYVRDIAEAFVLATETDTQSRVFNIGSGRGTSLNELIKIMVDVTGVTPEVTHDRARSLDVPVNVLDVSLARRELGWMPRTGLVDGIGRTWASLQR
jgi:UDP-glucose 4-epimerase